MEKRINIVTYITSPYGTKVDTIGKLRRTLKKVIQNVIEIPHTNPVVPILPPPRVLRTEARQVYGAID